MTTIALQRTNGTFQNVSVGALEFTYGRIPQPAGIPNSIIQDQLSHRGGATLRIVKIVLTLSRSLKVI